MELVLVWARARRSAAALATPRLLAPAATSFLLASRADFLFTEAHKQAIAETEYSLWCEQEERRDSSLRVPPLEPKPPAAQSGNRTSRSTSPVKDLNTLITSVAVKRRGSEDSIRTVYRADEQLPDSAYRSRSGLRHGQSERE